MAQSGKLVGNAIEPHAELGYFIDVFDHRPEMVARMEEKGLQGGGPTWAALVTAALELETPGTLDEIDFDDEADSVRVSCPSEATLQIVQTYVSLLMHDEDFMTQSVEQAEKGGYLE